MFSLNISLTRGVVEICTAQNTNGAICICDKVFWLSHDTYQHMYMNKIGKLGMCARKFPKYQLCAEKENNSSASDMSYRNSYK